MSIGIALVPVLLLLLLLQLMDSFKLVRPGSVLVAIGAGAAAAVLLLPFHDWLIDVLGLSVRSFSRYISPVTEETLKGLFIVFLLWRRRVGFLVDAAVLGFGVGAGFAVIENIDYLRELPHASLTLWLVRGLGTAVLHGATTAIFAMVSKTLMDRWTDRHALALLPGLALAIVIHSGFNHVPLPPLAMTFLILLLLPVAIIIVFQRSEASTRDWVGAGLDLDVELLELVRSEHFASTRFGTYLQELRTPFQRAGRCRHVLPAAPRARALGAGKSDAARARGRADHPGDAGPPHQPGGDPVPAVVDRPDRAAGGEAVAGHLRSRSMAPIPAGRGLEGGRRLTHSLSPRRLASEPAT